MTSQSDLLPIMTVTILLSLGQSESGLSVVIAQTIGHADRKAQPHDAIEQGNDLLRGDAGAQEAAAEIVGAQSLGRAFGPDLYAAVGHHFERESIAGGFADDSGEALGLARGPLDIDIDA